MPNAVVPGSQGVVVTSEAQKQEQANRAIQQGMAGDFNDVSPHAPVVAGTQVVQKVPTQARGGLGKASGLGRV
jgi:hypothetical protein